MFRFFSDIPFEIILNSEKNFILAFVTTKNRYENRKIFIQDI